MDERKLEIRYVPLSQVILWDRNPKKHDIGALVSSIRRYGFRDSPIYDKNVGIVAGSGRSLALAEMKRVGDAPPAGVMVDEAGEWFMPVQFGIDAESLAVAESFGVAHNNLTMAGGDFTAVDMMGMWDEKQYVELLQGLAQAEQLPETVDWEALESLMQVVSGNGNNGNDAGVAEPKIDQAKELQKAWGTQTGQIWHLGRHRLACGDMRDAELVSRLIGTDRIDMVLTDPPYGVDYEYDQFDDDPKKYEAWLETVWDSLPANRLTVITTGDAHLKWWFNHDPAGIMYWFDKTKQSPKSVSFLCKVEPIMVYGKVFTRYAWDIFEIQQPRGDGLRELHVCPKPLELWTALLQPQKGAHAVYDPFCGSGTTILTCERFYKKAICCELSPAYTAVCLQRYADTTNLKPVLIN